MLVMLLYYDMLVFDFFVILSFGVMLVFFVGYEEKDVL